MKKRNIYSLDNLENVGKASNSANALGDSYANELHNSANELWSSDNGVDNSENSSDNSENDTDNSTIEKNNKSNKQKVKPKSKTQKETEFGGTDREENHKKEEKFVLDLPDMKLLERSVLQSIVGQDEQVRKVITAIYRAKEFESIKANVLIIGNSGTGKTETIKQVAKRLRIPYTEEDATKYTQEGYWGADVVDMIYHLLDKTDWNLKKAENGIIIIDEIDKKAGHDEHDVSGVAVLNSFLKIIEGTTIEIENAKDPFGEDVLQFNTKGLIIIFLGAFKGLEVIRDKRLNRNALGFTKTPTQKEDKQKTRFLKQDLVKYGMPEEFVGRIDTIIEMNKLTKEDLAAILAKSNLSIFKRYRSELKKKGVKLVHSRKLYDIIAEKSLTLDTGARELSNTVNYIFENIVYEVLANPGKYTRCVLSPQIVDDNTKFELS